MRSTHSRIQRVLVVDDDPIFCKHLAAVGRRLEVKVVYCTSIKDLEILRYLDFDAVVVDYHMGRISGIDVASVIKPIAGKALPVVLTSSEEIQELAGSRWPICVKGFIPKSEGCQSILDGALAATCL